MPNGPPNQVTRILQDFAERPDAAEALLPLVYRQLRAIAQRRMSGERPDHTWEATELVHEAYMRLVGDRDMDWRSRGHFYAAAAESMRRILIDHARKRASQKRGAGKKPVPLVNVLDLAAEPRPEQILALDEALRRLADEDTRAAAVVELRFFAGLTVEEVAETMELSPRTVMREWTYARARLYQLLTDPEDVTRDDSC